jgi:hypothetical protein
MHCVQYRYLAIVLCAAVFNAAVLGAAESKY